MSAAARHREVPLHGRRGGGREEGKRSPSPTGVDEPRAEGEPLGLGGKWRWGEMGAQHTQGHSSRLTKPCAFEYLVSDVTASGPCPSFLLCPC